MVLYNSISIVQYFAISALVQWVFSHDRTLWALDERIGKWILPIGMIQFYKYSASPLLFLRLTNDCSPILGIS